VIRKLIGLARLLPCLALSLCLTCPPALAQEAPPHEGEGLPARSAAKKQVARPAKAQARPAVRKGQPARPAQAVQSGRKPAAKAPKKRKGGVQDDGKPYLRSLDKNHDGRITREEYLNPSKKRFAKADANRDGVISPQEGRTAKAKLLEKQAKADARRRAKGLPVKERNKSGRPPKPYLSTFDADKNGRVTQKEYLERRKQKFAEMDLNHDGVISREEARIAKQQILDRRAEKRALAKEKRLRKMEEAKQKAAASGVSADAPSVVLPAAPPPVPPAAPNAPEKQQGAEKPSVKTPMPPADEPLTPIAPHVPAQGEPAT
jgi:Ca2+-binding EF-hand superfamily protein